MPTITLTTDFGTADGYVGAMKGVIARIAPGAGVVDLTHEVPPQDLRAAAFALHRAIPYWPPGTVHCVVVDPGVGTSRRPLALRTADGQLLVGPDGGAFSLLCPPHTPGPPEAVELTEPRWWRSPEPSPTFHGRDVFAPVAAHLARMVDAGAVDLAAFGPRVDDLGCLDLPVPVEEEDGWRGEVVTVDHFGNAITNLPERALARPGLVVEVGGRTVPVVRTYADVDAGDLCALVGSSGWVEVACREDSAAERLGLAPGLPVALRPRSAE